MIYGKKRDDWLQHYPLLDNLIKLAETSWFNPNVCCFSEAQSDIKLTQLDVDDAEERLARFAPYLASVFPETQNGIIESPCKSIPHMQTALAEFYHDNLPGNLLLKMDNELPISGSIKARGGIYEVLKHAEDLALKQNIIQKTDNYILFNSDKFRQFFSQYEIAVGSTGNLGLSIGIMSTKLGFKTTVHMSADAREWKKALLRKHGANVIEYNSDYSKAVEEGRKQSQHNPNCYFVDDENSTTLFLGYAVAAKRLQKQLADLSVIVDKDHPLFVYLPCGVGGGPGGVAFGLKLIFKDNVHCIFAEPTHSPSMFLGVYTGLHDQICVQDFGIDNKTAADGLAVGRPSGFVGKSMQRMIDGFYTVTDDNLYRLLAIMFSTEKIKLEPSALAGLPGIVNVLNHQNCQQKHNLDDSKMKNATHIAWATGGSMVPDEIMRQYIEKGEKLLRKDI